jgi:hypothetical protein
VSDAVAERTTVPTVFEWQADAIIDAAKYTAHWVSTTPEERLSWQPVAEGLEHKGRSIYDQIHECSQVNRRLATVLLGGTPGEWVKEHSYTSSVQAEEDLKASAAEMAEVVRGLDDGALEREYATGMGPMKGAFIVQLAPMNMAYHGGQINQIQLLLGNPDFTFPE